MSETLDRQLEQHYKGVSNAELMRQMQSAEDFKYDDQAYELSRRLGAVGLAWKWMKTPAGEYVEIYSPAAAPSNVELGYD